MPQSVISNEPSRSNETARAAFVALAAASVCLSACGSVVIDDSSAGGGGASTTTTTSASTTSSSTIDTTSSSTTETFCECVSDADCPAGGICSGCICMIGEPLCFPGEVVSCYDGPAGTEGVGLCQAGTQTCADDGLSWGPCEGEIVPSPEQCDGADHDCDGIAGPIDVDGDGWTVCDGDCCEDAACSDHPEKVNPGAIEYPANQVDDDCNPATLDSDPYLVCSNMPSFMGTSSTKLLKAMDLCMFTTEDPPLPQRTWGVISAKITLADGSDAVQPKDVQLGVVQQYGPNVLPRYGTTMAALSSGTARALGDPGYVHPQNGPDPASQQGNYIAGTQAPIPADFLQANNGAVPAGCGGTCSVSGCETAFDSVALSVRIRVPTNMAYFSYDFDYYTAEYPENVCSEFNDFFVALLKSQAPADGLLPGANVAWDGLHHPISTNNASFQICAGCPGGTLELEGNGMGGWDSVLNDGAATGWTRAGAPVVPGEKIDLRFILWDAWDGNVDSLVLLDRFRWSMEPPLDPGP